MIYSLSKNMEITIDITGLTNKNEVLLRFNKSLEFGEYNDGQPIAIRNWDAFNDCLRYLDAGGINGTGGKIIFPCTLVIKGYSDYERANKKEFNTLKEILEDLPILYKKINQDIMIRFIL